MIELDFDNQGKWNFEEEESNQEPELDNDSWYGFHIINDLREQEVIEL